MIQELHILIGLPGCGKTTWAKKFKEDLEAKNSWIFSRVHVIHCDDGWIMPTKEHRYVVVDGIFTTPVEVDACIQKLSKYTIRQIFIHRWNDDIASCLWNDTNRRKQSSATTIRTLKIFDPTTVKFSFPVQIVEHTVVRKKECLKLPFIDDSEIIDDRYLLSQPWVIGGTYMGWNGHGTIAPEEPVEFVELDELLLNISTNFPFLVYKKIWRECVTIDEKTESDYYSNSCHQFYKCDLEKLYKMLADFKFV